MHKTSCKASCASDCILSLTCLLSSLLMQPKLAAKCWWCNPLQDHVCTHDLSLHCCCSYSFTPMQSHISCTKLPQLLYIALLACNLTASVFQATLAHTQMSSVITCSNSCNGHTCTSSATSGSNPIRAPCRGSCGTSSHPRPSALWPVLPFLSRCCACQAEAWSVCQGEAYAGGGHCTACQSHWWYPVSK